MWDTRDLVKDLRSCTNTQSSTGGQVWRTMAYTSCVIRSARILRCRAHQRGRFRELAGHKELSMTQRYMHLSPAALDAAIGLLDFPQRRSGRGDILETAIDAEKKVSG